MFCDLVGSTPLSVRFDPEDLRRIIGSYHRASGPFCAVQRGSAAGGAPSWVMTADQAAAPHPPRAVLLGRALRRRNGRGFPGGFVARYGERRSVDLNGLIEEALNLAYHGGRA
jgi:class 3 adenylate cyclase